MENIKFRAWDFTIQDYSEESFDSDVDEDQLQKMPAQYLVNTMSTKGPAGLQFAFELFTGVMDQDGVEMFAGDIIKCPKGRNDVIEFKKGAFWLRYRNITLHKFLYEIGAEVEVIGTIRKNSELAEV